MVEKISAVALRVANMRASVRFYKDVLGLEIIYGGEGSSLCRQVVLDSVACAVRAGSQFVSPKNLAETRTPKVAINDRIAYALGWIIAQTPNGNIVWHNGGTNGFGSYVGLELDRHIGVIVLTNQGNVGFPDAIGAWTFDQLWVIRRSTTSRKHSSGRHQPA
jgi:CubicO group peptidase (beta-lactamase class C family)